jgi:hypothetical protein
MDGVSRSCIEVKVLCYGLPLSFKWNSLNEKCFLVTDSFQVEDATKYG